MSCPNGYSRHESDIEKRCLWKHCVKPCMKNVATSPYYHVVITYVWLGASLSLYLINSDLLFNRLFPLYELISSFSFRLKQHFLLLKLYGGYSLKILQVTFGIKLFFLIPQQNLVWLQNLRTTFLQFQSKLCLCSWVGLKLIFPGKLHFAANISHLKNNISYFCSFSHLSLFWWRMFIMIGIRKIGLFLL